MNRDRIFITFKLLVIVSLFSIIYFTQMNVAEEIIVSIKYALSSIPSTIFNQRVPSIELNETSRSVNNISNPSTIPPSWTDGHYWTSEIKTSSPTITCENNIDLSVVVVTRNDDYGINSLERFTRFLQQWLHFPWSIKVEIVVVEWNFPEDGMKHIYEEASINSVLTSKNRKGITCVKFFTVPEKLATIPNKPGFDCPLFECMAKNVGLRRSKGTWKLTTNIDDVFSLSLCYHLNEQIRNKLLNADGFYSCRRTSMNSNQFSKFLPYNIKINMVNDCWVSSNEMSPRQCSVSQTNELIKNCGDFQMFHESLLYDVDGGGGFLEIPQNWGVDQEFLFRKMYVNNVSSYVIDNCPMCHQPHSKQYTTTSRRNGLEQNCNQLGVYWDLGDQMHDMINHLKFNKTKHPNWERFYKESNENWGLKGITLNFTLFNP